MTRVSLVTGANRGIGLETARQLARRGFHVVISARDEASGGHSVRGILAAGGKATFLALDVSDSKSIRDAAGKFASISDHLDVLINTKHTPSAVWRNTTFFGCFSADSCLMTGHW